MKTFKERKVILEPGVSFEVAQRISEYYEKEHFPHVIIAIENAPKRAKEEDEPLWEIKQTIFQELATFLSFGGLHYKAYVTKHTFRIVLLSASATIILEE